MPSLHELQAAFGRALLEPGSGLADWEGPPRAPAAGLEAYRRNVLGNARNALGLSYPVVKRLVGEGCFAQAVKAFVARHPSVSGDINDYGAEFGGFLAQWPVVASLPYLPDVARLEWAMERAALWDPPAPFDLAALAAIPPEGWNGLRFALHPAVTLLESPWPVGCIWRAHQDDEVQPVDLGAGSERLRIGQEDGRAVFETLAAGEFAFLAALATGETLAAALTQAAGVEAGFDLAAVLQRRALDGTLAALDDHGVA